MCEVVGANLSCAFKTKVEGKKTKRMCTSGVGTSLYCTCACSLIRAQRPGVIRRDENDAQEPGMMRREQWACAETNDSTQGLGRMHRDQCGAEDRRDAQELVRAQRPVAHTSDQPRRVHRDQGGCQRECTGAHNLV